MKRYLSANGEDSFSPKQMVAAVPLCRQNLSENKNHTGTELEPRGEGVRKKAETSAQLLGWISSEFPDEALPKAVVPLGYMCDLLPFEHCLNWVSITS